MKASKRSVGKRKARGRGRRPKKNSYNKGHWSKEEKRLFLVGLRKYGKGRWKEIKGVVTTRSSLQIKSYAQKMFKKLDASEVRQFEGVSSDLNEAEKEDEVGEKEEVVPCEQDDVPPVGLKLCDSTNPTTSGCPLARPVPRSPLGCNYFGARQDSFPSRTLFDLRFGPTDPSVSSSVTTQNKAPLQFHHVNQGDLLAAMALCELALVERETTTGPPVLSRATSSAFCTVPDSTFQPVASVKEMKEDSDMLPFLVTRKDGCQEQNAAVVTPTDFA